MYGYSGKEVIIKATYTYIVLVLNCLIISFTFKSELHELIAWLNLILKIINTLHLLIKAR